MTTRWRTRNAARWMTFGVTAIAALSGSACSSDDATPPTALTAKVRTVFVLERQQDDLADFVEAVSTPGSPQYQQYLTVEAVANTYGASDATIAALRTFLVDLGDDFEVDSTRTVMRGDIRPDDVRRILGSETKGTNAEVPAGLAGIVTSVHGAFYNLHGDPAPKFRHHSGGSSAGDGQTFAPDDWPARNMGSGTHDCPAREVSSCYNVFQNPGPPYAYQSFDPSQLQTAYGVESIGLTGSGTSAVVLEWGEQVAASDIQAYAAGLGYDEVTLNQIQGSGSPSTSVGLEATIDVETIVGMAPGLTQITLINGAGDNFISDASELYSMALDRSNTNGILTDVISVSYGACEDEWLNSAGTELGSGGQALMTVLQSAGAAGVTVVVSTGDQGSSGCSSRTPPYTNTLQAVVHPASSPYVTAAGGASIDLNSENEIVTAVPWNNWGLQLDVATQASSCTTPPCRPYPVWAGGGGISELFNVPTWQTSVNSGSDSGRGMPDLVYLSDVYPAVTLYFQGGWVGEGNGTSQAAPTFAAMVMLLNQSLGERVGLVNPALYSLGADTPSAYFDITTGDNIIGNQFEQFKVSCCAASAGYDFASGWGIMNVNTAANNWPE